MSSDSTTLASTAVILASLPLSNRRLKDAVARLHRNDTLTGHSLVKAIQALDDKAERKKACIEVLDFMESANQRIQGINTDVYDYLVDGRKDLGITQKDIDDRETFAASGRAGQTLESRLRTLRPLIESTWGQGVCDLPQIKAFLTTQNSCKIVRSIVGRVHRYSDFTSGMNASFITRLRAFTPGPGRHTTTLTTMQTSELNAVLEGNVPVAAGGPGRIPIGRNDHLEVRLDPWSGLYYVEGHHPDPAWVPAGRTRMQRAESDSLLRQATTAAGVEVALGRSLSTGSASGRGSPARGSPSRSIDLPIRQSPSQTRESSSPSATPSTRRGSRLSAEYQPSDSGSPSPSGKGRSPKQLGQDCICTQGKGNKDALGYVFSLQGRKYSDDHISLAVEMLMDFAKPLTRDATDIYCRRHLWDMGRILGLRINMDSAEIVNRMGQLRVEMESGLTWSALLVHPKYTGWFLVQARPSVASDSLGPYSYHVVDKRWGFKLGDMLFTANKEKDADMLKEAGKLIGLTKQMMEAFERDGSINMDNFFAWWEDAGVAQIGRNEFDMYRFHLREINGRPNLGWLRNCFYSLIQQAMRMDISYWLLYFLLRPDHRMWLISYPYYAKYTMVGDKTQFRHIDLNIQQMADQKRGLDQIQGSVSLDDETKDDCTEIVPGMHKPEVLKEWAKRWKARDGPQGKVQAVTKELLTPQDLKDFNTRWTDVPCKRFGVRVTSPCLPHGAHGPAKSVRRTMLPWFVGIAKDHIELEVKEGGTWEELSRAHRDLVPGPSTPSGLPNKYGAPPYAFPGSVRLEVKNPLSQAMVGRRKYTDLEVQQTMGILLYDKNRERAKAMIAENRKDIAAAVIDGWERVKALEKNAFTTTERYTGKGVSPGSKSFVERFEVGIANMPKKDRGREAIAKLRNSIVDHRPTPDQGNFETPADMDADEVNIYRSAREGTPLGALGP